jgi:hypothetical protein
MDMIEQAAGGSALQQIGQRVGMSPDQLRSVVGSLAPMLEPKLAEHAATGGLEGTPVGDDAPSPGSHEADEHGRSVLGSILGSKDASRSVATDASADTGVDVEKIKSLLPQIASIAATAMAGRQGGAGGIGGLLGSLLGGSDQG